MLFAGLLEAYFTGKLDELSQKWCGNEVRRTHLLVHGRQVIIA